MLQLKPGQSCTYSFGCPGIRGSEWKVWVLKNTLCWQACVVLTEKENFGLLKIGTLIGLCRANEAIVKMGSTKGLFLNIPEQV